MCLAPTVATLANPTDFTELPSWRLARGVDYSTCDYNYNIVVGYRHSATISYSSGNVTVTSWMVAILDFEYIVQPTTSECKEIIMTTNQRLDGDGADADLANQDGRLTSVRVCAPLPVEIGSKIIGPAPKADNNAAYRTNVRHNSLIIEDNRVQRITGSKPDELRVQISLDPQAGNTSLANDDLLAVMIDENGSLNNSINNVVMDCGDGNSLVTASEYPITTQSLDNNRQRDPAHQFSPPTRPAKRTAAKQRYYSECVPDESDADPPVMFRIGGGVTPTGSVSTDLNKSPNKKSSADDQKQQTHNKKRPTPTQQAPIKYAGGELVQLEVAGLLSASDLAVSRCATTTTMLLQDDSDDERYISARSILCSKPKGLLSNQHCH